MPGRKRRLELGPGNGTSSLTSLEKGAFFEKAATCLPCLLHLKIPSPSEGSRMGVPTLQPFPQAFLTGKNKALLSSDMSLNPTSPA